MQKQPIFSPLNLALVGITLAIFFFSRGTGKYDLIMPCEVRIVQVTREMERNQDLIQPFMHGKIRLQKPPLAYWLTLFSRRIFGTGPWSARLPSAITAALSLFLFYKIITLFHASRSSLSAVLILGSNGAFWLYARLAAIEMPLLTCNLLAIYAWLRSRTNNANQNWILLIYIALAASALLKGPVGPLYVLGLILAERFLQGVKPGKKAQTRLHATGIMVFLLLVLPWPIAIAYTNPEGLQTWLHEFGGRFAGFDHIKPWYYYASIIPLDGLPWIPLLVWAAFIRYFVKGEIWQKTPSWRFPWIWIAFTLLFFSIPASKKHSYLLPLYVPVAWIIGNAITTVIESAKNKRSAKQPGILLILGFIFLSLSVFIIFGGIQLSGYVKLIFNIPYCTMLWTAAFFATLGIICFLTHKTWLSALSTWAAGTLIIVIMMSESPPFANAIDFQTLHARITASRPQVYVYQVKNDAIVLGYILDRKVFLKNDLSGISKQTRLLVRQSNLIKLKAEVKKLGFSIKNLTSSRHYDLVDVVP